MKHTTLLIFALILSFSAQAEKACEFSFESDVPEFFATMGDSYNCSMVEMDRVKEEIVLKCDHVLGSSFVKDLKVSQSFVEEHFAILAGVPMDEQRRDSRRQRVFRKAIMAAYKGSSCLTQADFQRKDKESIKDKLVATGDKLQGDIEAIAGLEELQGSLADVEVFDGNRYPKPDFGGALTGRVPDEDDSHIINK